jgi:hypothetical protein
VQAWSVPVQTVLHVISAFAACWLRLAAIVSQYVVKLAFKHAGVEASHASHRATVALQNTDVPVYVGHLPASPPASTATSVFTSLEVASVPPSVSLLSPPHASAASAETAHTTTSSAHPFLEPISVQRNRSRPPPVRYFLVVRALLLFIACTCIAPGTDDEETRRADVVFVGTVTNITEPKPGQPNTAAMLAVETAIKGTQLNTTLTVDSPAASNLCGFHFERGKRYKVFAYKDHGVLTTHVCTASRQI